jgi:hypothetical protein
MRGALRRCRFTSKGDARLLLLTNTPGSLIRGERVTAQYLDAVLRHHSARA